MRHLHMLSHRRWWVLWTVYTAVFVAWTGPGVDAVVFGLVGGAIAATMGARFVGPNARWIRPVGALKFIPYFLWIALRGGVDVARRTFSPSLSLRPAMVAYRLRIAPDSEAAAFFAAVISLVPGTLCVEYEAQGPLQVHVIDVEGEFEAELERLERRAAMVFGEPLNDGE